MGLPKDLNTLLVEMDEQGIATCTFNRPKVRNALSREMVNEIRLVLQALAADSTCRVLIFTGAGEKSFISGADISELLGRTAPDALLRINTALFREIETFPHPTIAAVRGYALGGGCELAMACDIRFAGEGARFGQPEVGLGIIPGAGGCYRLAQLVGLAYARELIFSGRLIDATEAHGMGLVNRVVPDDEVLATAGDLARQIARNSGLAIRYAKLAINNASEMGSEARMAFEASAQAVLFDDEGKNQRMQAFLDRRKAKKN